VCAVITDSHLGKFVRDTASNPFLVSGLVREQGRHAGPNVHCPTQVDEV
jgi:hypothetical protein